MRQVYLEGLTYGKLKVVRFVSTYPRQRYECLCACGRTVLRYVTNLHPKSNCRNCSGNRGCRNKPLGATWKRMIARCTNPKESRYANYGGRGIKVCSRWLRSFDAFERDVGPKPGPGFTIDRIDNDGDYRPGNIRWATRTTQQNNRSVSVLAQYKGRTQTLGQWSTELHIPYMRLYDGRRRGLTLEETLVYYKAMCTIDRLTAVGKHRKREMRRATS